jgi:hypothetical protein
MERKQERNKSTNQKRIKAKADRNKNSLTHTCSHPTKACCQKMLWKQKQKTDNNFNRLLI